MNKATRHELIGRYEEAVSFLLRGISAHQGRGLSHSYSFWINPIQSWHQAYPEVTGYTLPTLFQIKGQQQETAREYAEHCINWLLSIQSKEGWWYGGVDFNQGPSFFNSAMIIGGLTDAYNFSSNPQIPDAIQRCLEWMLKLPNPDGSITQHAYVPNFQPTYYTRAAWAILKSSQLVNSSSALQLATRLFKTTKSKIHNWGIEDAGFEKGKPAFLHTIAYTLRGQFEFQTLIGDQVNLPSLETLLKHRNNTQSWPGAITMEGPKHTYFDHSFRCPTGEAQMTILILKLSIETHLPMAISTIQSILKSQARRGPKKGGIPGSIPVWGPYMRWRYPSWATKFIVDALQLILFPEKSTISG